MLILHKKIKKETIRNLILTILITLFYGSYFLKNISGNNTIGFNLANLNMFFIGILGFIYFLTMCKFKNKTKIFISFAIVYFFSIISSLHTMNYRLQDYILPLQYFGIALILINTKISQKLIGLNFSIYAIYFFFLALKGINPDNVFINVSRNNISVIMIIQTILLYVSDIQNKKEIKILPGLLNVLISFWGIGRSGIITSLVLLLGIVIIKLIFENSSCKKLKLFASIIVITVFLIVVITLYYDIIFSKALNRSIGIGLVDPNRSKIIQVYFSGVKSSFSNFIFGVPVFNNKIFENYDYNLHNSFLRLHAYYGCIGFFTVIIFLIWSFFYSIKKKKFFYLLFLSIIVLRMSTDITNFNGPFDPILYYIMFNLILK